MSSSAFASSVTAVQPTSTPLTRRLGNHQYERKVPIATAGMYDWKVTGCFNKPIHTGQPNAFPRRLPSAGSEKLRQMYLNTDTVSGRLVLDSAQQRSRQKRFMILKRTLEQQAKELEERNRQLNTRLADDSSTLTPPESAKEKSLLLTPTIRPSRGMTIIKESRCHTTPEPTSDEETPVTAGNDKMHAEMSIYLPRADLAEDSYVTQPSSQVASKVSGYSTNPIHRRRLSDSTHHTIRYTFTDRLEVKTDRPKTVRHKREHGIPHTTADEKEIRPITANW